MTTILHGHAAFTDTYSLLEELWAAGEDFGLGWPARAQLAQALNELTDCGRHTPDAPVPPFVTTAAEGFARFEVLLHLMLADVTDLASTLRLVRVRDLVAEARRAR